MTKPSKRTETTLVRLAVYMYIVGKSLTRGVENHG